jgi:hypothetical protein
VEATADVFAGTDGAAGLGLVARGRVAGLAYGVAARRIFGDPGPGTLDTRDEEDGDGRFVPGRELESLTAFAEDTTELDLDLGYQLGVGPRLGLRGFWRTDGGGETFSIGPNLFWPLGRLGGARFDLVAEAAVTDAEEFVFARLRVGFDTGPWRSWAEAGYGGGDDRGATAAAYLARDLVDRAAHRLTLAGRFDRVGAVTSLGGELDYRGLPGRLQLTAAHDRDGDRDGGGGVERFAAQGATTVAAGLGGVGVIGRRAGASALLAHVDAPAGAAADAVFEVVVDDRGRRRLRPGERVAVPLAAYDAYRVRLKQVEGPLAGYDGRTRTISLYPGSVASERWTVRPLVTVFARLVDTAGAPLADARLETRPPAFTDARGYFQAELGAGRPTLAANVGGRTCRLELPALASTSGYHRLGDVPCRPVDSPAP